VKAERRFIDFMQDIVDNLEKAESFTRGMEFEDFLEDEKTRYSVICALEIVGEACKIGAYGGQAKKSSSSVEGDGRHEGQAHSWLFRSG
jgi:hypothetical protein